MIKQVPDPDVAEHHVAELKLLNERLVAAQNCGKRDDASAAMAQLTSAVGEARVAGVGWAAIGAALDVARGNAYQRFRQSPARAVVVE